MRFTTRRSETLLIHIDSFGYDTGQISGFLEMPDFLRRFGQHRADGEPYFSDVRSGLIVAMVRDLICNGCHSC